MGVGSQGDGGFSGDIWSTGLELPGEEVERLGRCLSSDERERANRFKFERDRRRFIVARGNLRQILSDYLDLTPEKITFNYSSKGKPEIVGSRLQFNVSHSHELAIYGISWEGAIGVDLEFIRPVDSLMSLTERYFCESEREEVKRSGDRTETFFRLWTAKEAYLKATGEGIAGGLERTEVCLNPLGLVRVRGWSLRELILDPRYRATLCYRSLD